MGENDPKASAAQKIAEAEAAMKAAQEQLEAAKKDFHEAHGAPEEAAAPVEVVEQAAPEAPVETVAEAVVETQPAAAETPAPAPTEPVAPVVEPIPPFAGQQQVPPQQQMPPQGYPGYAPQPGQQPVGGQQPYYVTPSYVPSKDRVAAGLLAIFLGSLGIHKFYLGYSTAGFIMLAVTLVGSIFTFGIAAAVMGVISIVEGVMYLVKTQSEFEETYVYNKREWF